MARLLIKLENGADGEIELLDNGVYRVLENGISKTQKVYSSRHRIQKKNTVGINTGLGEEEQVKNWYETETLELKKTCSNRVNTAIDGLHEENIQWTRGKLDINCNKADCNRLHRGFTTLSFTHLWTDNIPNDLWSTIN